jgi:hypothetical protein
MQFDFFLGDLKLGLQLFCILVEILEFSTALTLHPLKLRVNTSKINGIKNKIYTNNYLSNKLSILLFTRSLRQMYMNYIVNNLYVTCSFCFIRR